MRLLALLLVLLSPAPLYAANNEQHNGGETSLWHGNTNLMFYRDEPRAFARYPEDILELADENDGFYTQLALVSVYQHASSSKTSRNELGNLSWNFGGGWTAVENGGFSWWIRGGLPFDKDSNADLSKDIGSKLDVNATLESKEIYLRELYWVQQPLGGFRYSLGWIDSSYRYDFNEVANDDLSGFLSAALVNDVAIPFPDAGIAIDFLWEPSDILDLHWGLYQANCDKESFRCIDGIKKDELFVPAELRFSTESEGLGEGNYRLMGYYKQSKGKSGSGFGISLDQRFGSLLAFLRLGFSDEDISEFKHSFSIGGALDAPLGRGDDRIGLGFSSGRTSGQNTTQEKLWELYWRFQLTPFLSMSPHLQYVVDPADNPQQNSVTVVSGRLLLEF